MFNYFYTNLPAILVSALISTAMFSSGESICNCNCRYDKCDCICEQTEAMEETIFSKDIELSPRDSQPTQPSEYAREKGTRLISVPPYNEKYDWMPWKFCKPGYFIYAFKVKVDAKDGDNAGLTGIQFNCATLDEKHTEKFLTEHTWGNWKSHWSCVRGYLTGYQLEYDNDEKWFDSKGAMRIHFYCKSRDASEEGWFYSEGLVGEMVGAIVMCPEGEALCGMTTQHMPYSSTFDNKALLNIEMYCCPIPHPATTCTPKDELNKHGVITNPGHEFITNAFEYVVGISLSIVYLLAERTPIRNNTELLGIDIFGDTALRLLEKNYRENLPRGKDSDFMWSTFNFRSLERLSVKEIFVQVPPCTRVDLYQVMSHCGPYYLNVNELDMEEISICDA